MGSMLRIVRTAAKVEVSRTPKDSNSTTKARRYAVGNSLASKSTQRLVAVAFHQVRDTCPFVRTCECRD